MTRILVFELLHADENLYQSAPAALKAEGRAMLLAIASDLSQWPDSEVAVAVVSDAFSELSESASGFSWKTCVNVASLISDANEAGESFDVAFCIAPEEGGSLQQTVSLLRRNVSRVICVRDELVMQGSDKRAFHDWCVSRNLPTIPLLDSAGTDSWQFCKGEEVVAKPRFGVGCESVTRYPWAAETQRLIRHASASEWIWQPYLDGKLYSFGLIGTGLGRQAIVLPVAEQIVRWVDSSPRYLGGRVPCCDKIAKNLQLTELIQAVVRHLAVDDGYVGVDMMHCPDDLQAPWRVVEMNPRLCTSYLGYRQLFSCNLARFWWDSEVEPIDPPRGKVVDFHTGVG